MKVARDLVRTYGFETHLGDTIIRREPIGVCALISPWNWPVQTPVIKAIYGLAAGCTVVLKPSDVSPVSALMLARVMEEAGVPEGVFNLVLGRGSVVGHALSAHPDIDMISFTGSTSAGIKVGEAAAQTVKRVCLELGGKSANIVLKDADLEKSARWNIQRCFFNTGQSCHAPSRMLVHESQVESVIPFLVDEASKYRIGEPREPATTMGPVVEPVSVQLGAATISRSGWTRVPASVCGGLGRPKEFNRATSQSPTVFVDVAPEMVISQGGDFRPGSGRDSLRDRGRGAPDRQRLAPTGSAGMSSRATARRGTSSRAACGRGGSASTAPSPTPLPPWAATSSQASAAQWASWVWRNISR